MEKLTGLDFKIMEMAQRIRELREITRFTPAEIVCLFIFGVPLFEMNCRMSVFPLGSVFRFEAAVCVFLRVREQVSVAQNIEKAS